MPHDPWTGWHTGDVLDCDTDRAGHCHDYMVVRLTTTYAISAYHH